MQSKVTNWRCKGYVSEVCALLLSLLFTYTAISKLYDWEGTKNGLYNQVFAKELADLLLYGLPPVELLAAVFLLITKKRKLGFWLSAILMTVFSLYIGIVMTGVFGRIPCSCGGILNSLGWGEHLVFNLIFLGIAVIGLKATGD